MRSRNARFSARKTQDLTNRNYSVPELLAVYLCGQPGGELPRQPHSDPAVGQGLDDGVDVGRSGARHAREGVLLRFGNSLAYSDAREELFHQLSVVRGCAWMEDAI